MDARYSLSEIRSLAHHFAANFTQLGICSLATANGVCKIPIKKIIIVRKQIKELIVMGAVLMSTFLTAFWLLVPQFQSEGASTAILIGFIITSILTLIWSERKLFKFIIIAMVAVGISSSIGYLLLSVLYYEIIVIIITAAIAFVIVLALKLTSTTELGGFIKNVIKKTN